MVNSCRFDASLRPCAQYSSESTFAPLSYPPAWLMKLQDWFTSASILALYMGGHAVFWRSTYRLNHHGKTVLTWYEMNVAFFTANTCH